MKVAFQVPPKSPKVLASSLSSAQLMKNKNGIKEEFDGFWSSSLTDSTAMGKPDNESLENSQRLLGIDQIFDVSSFPQ